MQNTRSDVQAIAVPIQRMDTDFHQLVQQGQDTITRLSETQVHTRQLNENVSCLSRTISDQYRQILRGRTSSSRFEHDLMTALVELGAERELLRREMRRFDQKREDEAAAAGAKIVELVGVP